MQRLVKILISVFICNIYGNLLSQSITWEKTAGLNLNKINAISIAKNNFIYVGTNEAGMFRSTDNGNSWADLNKGLTSKIINCIAINKTGLIFIGTSSNGIYRFVDSNQSWKAVNKGLTNQIINSIIVTNNNILLTATSGGGIFKSTDNGENWTSLNNGLDNKYVYSLDENSRGDLFAGTFVGIYRSMDNGENWVSANVGFPTTYVFCIIIDDNNVIYAGTNVDGVLRSTNSGESWTKLNTGLTKYDVRTIIINYDKHIFLGTKGGGIFKLSDDGNSWSSVNSGLTNLEIVALAVNSTGYIFAGSVGKGVFKSVQSTLFQPTTITDDPTEIKENSVFINGRVNSNGIRSNVKFQFGTSLNYDKDITPAISEVSDTGLVQIKAWVTNLQSNTTYHYRIIATNIVGTSYGEDKSFKTNDIASNITFSPSSLTFSVVQDGNTPAFQNLNLTKSGNSDVIWNAESNVDWLDVQPKSGQNNGILKISIKRTDLNPNSYLGKILISSQNISNSPIIVNVKYQVLSKPIIKLNQTVVKFDNVKIGNSKDFSLNVLNIGQSPLIISSVKMSGSDTNVFKIKKVDSIPLTIDPNRSSIILLTYKPVSVGNNFASFEINHNSQGSVLVLSLSGYGIATDIAPPVLISPNNSGKAVSTNPLLIWKKVKNALSYNIQVSRYNDFSLIDFQSSGIQDTQIVVSANLFNGRNYYWRACSKDSLGLGAFSNPNSFFTIENPPETVRLLLPLNTDNKINISSLFKWNSAVRGNSYEIQISRNPNFDNNSIVFSKSNIYDTTILVTNLDYLNLYYWKIRASNTGGVGPWSEMFSFSTIGKAAKISIVSGNTQSTKILSQVKQSLKVKVTDIIGNPVSNVPVKFSFSSIPSNSFQNGIIIIDSITNSSGEASVSVILGTKVGTYNILAESDLLEGSPLTFTLFATAGDPTVLSVFSGNNQTNDINKKISYPFMILVFDNYGNPVEKTQIEFKISEFPTGSTNHYLTTSDTLTNFLGQAQSQLSFGEIPGKYKVTAFLVSSPETKIDLDFTAKLPVYSSLLKLNTDLIKFPTYQKLLDFKTQDWRIFGIPGASNKLISEFLDGYVDVDWQAVHDNGRSYDYLIPFDNSNLFADSVGKAFWIISKSKPKLPTTILSAPLNQNQEIEISLHTGWNLITNPYTSPIIWERILEYNNIKSLLFSYNGKWNISSLFEPYQGYFFDNITNLPKLIIPYYLAFTGTSKKFINYNFLNDVNWKINIELSDNESSDELNWIGTVNDTNQFYKIFRKPRTINNLAEIKFKENQSEQFIAYIKIDNPELNIWEFELKDLEKKEYKLKFSGISGIVPPKSVVLYNLNFGVSFDLSIDSIYSFKSSQNSYKFKLLIGKNEMVTGEIQNLNPFKKFSIEKNYPNPFNPSTTIPIIIAEETDCNILIYNTLGSEVKTLYKGTINSGYYLFNWDGMNNNGDAVSSGIYFVRFISKDVRISSKMILIR